MRKALAVAVLAFALIAATGCGSDSDASSDSGESSDTAATTTTLPPPKVIVDHVTHKQDSSTVLVQLNLEICASGAEAYVTDDETWTLHWTDPATGNSMKASPNLYTGMGHTWTIDAGRCEDGYVRWDVSKDDLAYETPWKVEHAPTGETWTQDDATVTS
jgi:hypothetical protein